MEPDAGLIEIRIARIDQLFNSFDPSPFDERDLDDDAKSHIAGWARELPKDVPICLLLHMPKEEAQRAQERGLARALTHYFELRAQWIERDRRELFRLGWRYLAMGLVVLTGCLLLSQLLPRAQTSCSVSGCRGLIDGAKCTVRPTPHPSSPSRRRHMTTRVANALGWLLNVRHARAPVRHDPCPRSASSRRHSCRGQGTWL